MNPLARASRAVLALCALLPLAALTSAAPATAQLTPARLSPADSAAVLLRTAAVFEDRGRWDVAEALYQHLLERYGGTDAAEQARSRLDAGAAQGLGRSGSVELQVWSTVYGLWLGLAVPLMADANDPEAYGVGLLVGGPAGWLVAHKATRSRSLGGGQVRAITWGGTWGTFQGLGWAEVFDLREETFCDPFGCYRSDDGGQERIAAAVVGGLAGIAAGAVVARNPVRAGVASGANGGSLGGAWLGFAGAHLLDAEGDVPLAAALVGGNAGLLAGALVAKKYDMSRDRVRLISLGGLVGILGGLGLDLILQPDDEQAVAGIPLVTSIAGIALAAHATRDYHRVR